MNRNLRIVTAVVLAAILAATSLTMAIARGQTRVAGEVVICTGYGVTTISVDANGDPVGPVHLCPDMVLGLMAALDTPPPVLTRPEGRVERIEAPVPVRLSAQSAPIARARGPPALI
ncbi:MAG: hypothetical protein PHX82_10860 [Paracoccaceae bacterium]|jgi:hypothetical protein|nr:hypothetical protein [Paracoccaceae bacterium]